MFSICSTKKLLKCRHFIDWSGRHEDSFENAKNAFSPAVLFLGSLFNVLPGEKVSGRPRRSKATRRKKCEGDCSAPTSAGGPEAEGVL
jgi:hypothetical protein